ncbi:MAG: methenyltetrahydromethanopterin cyclohydrolase [Candidatus Bathyarchaeia archaeon]
MGTSVNIEAIKLVKSAIKNNALYRIKIKKIAKATIIDAGVETQTGALAGKLAADICLGGLARTRLTYQKFGEDTLPSVFVETCFPAVATLGSQYAGWQIKTKDYFAMGSGPARALARKPKSIYDKINYSDSSKESVIVLESDKLPTKSAIDYICDECKISNSKLYVLVTPTSSLAGSIQIAGRVVETGIHKLTEIGFDPKTIVFGCGYAPIPPVHPDSMKAMGRTNDVILYGGVTNYFVNHEDDETLKKTVAEAPSSCSRDYGRPFYEIFREAKFDFYKIDPNLFAPAVITINNMKTGLSYTAGTINEKVLKDAIGLRRV